MLTFSPPISDLSQPPSKKTQTLIHSTNSFYQPFIHLCLFPTNLNLHKTRKKVFSTHQVSLAITIVILWLKNAATFATPTCHPSSLQLFSFPMKNTIFLSPLPYISFGLSTPTLDMNCNAFRKSVYRYCFDGLVTFSWWSV